MDTQTQKFYSDHHKTLQKKYDSGEAGVSAYFEQAFLPEGAVLDIGCGSGRDLNTLLSKRYEAKGIDSCAEFLGAAVENYPALQGRVSQDALPGLKTVDDHAYDGVLCSAVLMHLPEELLFDSVYSIRRVLKENGRLLISVPVGLKIKGDRDKHGRLYNGVTPDNFQLIFERIGFRLMNRWDDHDSLGRPERRWATMLFCLETADGIRSLDKIEGVLNKDRKTATYKLALFRALAEIAMTSYNSALWLPEGRVAIPVGLISEKWLEYFWPIIDSDRFIPQIRGERPGCRKPIAFRKSLETVIDAFQNLGGLSGFSVAFRNHTLPESISADISGLIRRLNKTIVNGPVYYSGGGGSKIFEYNSGLKAVEMDAGIWRELSMMGSWIIDATILRWAELTAEISGNDLRPSQIIDCLLVTPIPERDTKAARDVFDEISDKDCVWSGKTLSKKYDVDHVIPFALWKNNDLWNLLPADANVNNSKRDKLPEYGLLAARKDCIIYYWTNLRNAFLHRFEYEASKFAGKTMFKHNNWENKLFSSLSEAVEITATQRGVGRWAPKGYHAPGVSSARKNKGVDDSKADAPEVIFFPPKEEQYVTCVPFFDLKAAAGAFSSDQFVEEAETHERWITVDNIRLAKGMFVIQVTGRSMEPVIRDGDFCLFRTGSALGGTRQGRIVLVQHRSFFDPDTSTQLTVKKYFSTKIFDEYGNPAHVNITLKPLNPAYGPISIDHVDSDEEFKIIAEFVSVLR